MIFYAVLRRKLMGHKMDTQISNEDLKQIENGIKEKYSKVATRPEGHFRYPTGRKGLEALNYDSSLLERLSDEVASSYCGVGNPFSLGPINPGEQVLDIGCGAGVDAILAAMMVGPQGLVTGVDIVTEMIEKAKSNLQLMKLDNVNFQKVSGEDLPFSDLTYDVVLSNGVINLIADKEAAMSEIIRVLKPSGRLMMADQITTGSVQKDIKTRLASWFQ
jgi:2-polyprenyl-3-methyl-5-hydroxy-6-metoxy-1,4-benzoquinol methylase